MRDKMFNSFNSIDKMSNAIIYLHLCQVMHKEEIKTQLTVLMLLFSAMSGCPIFLTILLGILAVVQFWTMCRASNDVDIFIMKCEEFDDEI